MRIVMFYHSLVSDWNHGNAHFLRGIATELIERGHDVAIYEPRDGWSRQNLLRDYGPAALDDFSNAYPQLRSHEYDLNDLDLDLVLRGAELVLVHEWSDHALVGHIGRHRVSRGNYTLLFHDTHHRSVTDPASMAQYPLAEYDGVLAYGDAIRAIYEHNRWAKRVWTWHEAADTRVFRPVPSAQKEADLVWIGNWGDDERTAELHEFLLDPVRRLSLKARVYGVRYPDDALRALSAAGIEYGGWLPNYRVPETFSRYRVTVHVPRRPYATALPGIPTIRPFEALACGVPLISAPWDDAERLFRPGSDYLVAKDGAEMTAHLRRVLDDPALAQRIAASGRARVLERHTCAHRVEQLLSIVEDISPERQHSLITTGKA